MLEAIEQDGTLIVTESPDCAIYATYDNKLAPGRGEQTYTLDNGAIVRIIKGGGELPETLEVTWFGIVYEVQVPDYTKGELCVPWPVVG